MEKKFMAYEMNSAELDNVQGGFVGKIISIVGGIYKIIKGLV